MSIEAIGGYDIFNAKFDSSGKCLWARRAGGDKASCYCFQQAIDDSGNLYVAGHFNKTITFDGAASLESAGEYDIFIAKYDSSGICAWAKKAGGSKDDFCYGIDLDKSDNPFICGTSLSAASSFGDITLTSNGGYDAFYAKYDPSGSCVSAKNVGGKYSDAAFNLKFDKVSGDFYLQGCLNGTVVFGNGISITSVHSVTFLAKYDSQDSCQWAIKNAASRYSWSDISEKSKSGNESMALTSGGSIYIATYRMIFMGYDSSGNCLFSENKGNAYPFDIAADSSGNLYSCGRFPIINYFGEGFLIPSNSNGFSDIFIAKYLTQIPESVTLTTKVSPQEAGTAAPATITVPSQMLVEINATPADGWKFYKWTCEGTVVFADELSASTTATPSTNATLTANFLMVTPVNKFSFKNSHRDSIKKKRIK